MTSDCIYRSISNWHGIDKEGNWFYCALKYNELFYYVGNEEIIIKGDKLYCLLILTKNGLKRIHFVTKESIDLIGEKIDFNK